MERPEIIMAPGPTPVPPDVLAAQGAPLVYHRGPGYGDLLREVNEGLKKIYRTSSDVLIFSASGTGGLESAVSNLFSPGDPVLVPVAGYFGERFAKIAAAAWKATKTAKNPRFYFDWALYKEAFDLPSPENPFTPAISLMQGMRAALRRYFEEGPDQVLKRHQILSEATKEGVRALGLDLFGEHLERAWAVTAIRAPEGVDGNELVARVRKDHRIILAPGQGPLKGNVFRIGHLGYYDRFDIIRCLAALEMTLETMGYPVKRGAAVAAAEGVFANSHP